MQTKQTSSCRLLSPLCGVVAAVVAAGASGCDSPDPFDSPSSFLAAEREHAYDFEQFWDDDIWSRGVSRTATFRVTGTFEPEAQQRDRECRSCGVYTIRTELKRVFSRFGDVNLESAKTPEEVALLASAPMPAILGDYRYRVVLVPDGGRHGIVDKAVSYLADHAPGDFSVDTDRLDDSDRPVLRVLHEAERGPVEISLSPNLEPRSSNTLSSHSVTGIGTFVEQPAALGALDKQPAE